MPSIRNSALLQHLSRGPASAAGLGGALGVSQPTLSRALRALERSGEIVRMLGTTRGARYGLHRSIGTAGTTWPLYRIGTTGMPEEIATLHAIERHHFYVHGGSSRIAGLFEGVPYYLQDARPSGFLGRAIPAAHPELSLPARISDWTDEHFLVYLTRRGSESVGDLVLGSEALDRHLADRHGPKIVAQQDRPVAYPALAAAAMAGAPPGSSAQGEHPKFMARLEHGQTLTHVLVKFSPPRTTPFGLRWADLLIAEHLAGRMLAAHGLAAARAELLEYADQSFLQSERFDRIGAEGRRGVVSLLALDAARYGRLDSWSAAAQRLVREHLLSPEDGARITLLDAFGALIANSDRHFGNITLYDDREGSFELAPAYDMLPMLFAPRSGQLVERDFEPPRPSAANLPAWAQACAMAEDYWRRLTAEARLSESFRTIAERCLAALRAVSRRSAGPAS